MWLWIVLIAIIIVFVWFKFYRFRYDTVIAYTGGLGSGKTFRSVKNAKTLLRKNRAKVARHNLWESIKRGVNKKYVMDVWEKPNLYASIPVRISDKEWAIELRPEHLLLTKRIAQRSVVLIDEIGSWASQFDFDKPNLKKNFDEFVRFYRHYTKGGYLVVNDQCSENIVLYVRRRINTVFNLMHFQKWFGIVYTIKVRNISISEEIKTVEEQDTEDNMTLLIGLIGFFKDYDTYCYSERYATVPLWRERVYSRYKKNRLLVCPSKQITPKTDNVEKL